MGKKSTIAVFADKDYKDECSQADLWVDETILENIKSGKIEFSKLICTTDMLPKLKPLAKILGPKGLMPNAKVGTLIKNSELE